MVRPVEPHLRSEQVAYQTRDSSFQIRTLPTESNIDLYPAPWWCEGNREADAQIGLLVCGQGLRQSVDSFHAHDKRDSESNVKQEHQQS